MTSDKIVLLVIIGNLLTVIIRAIIKQIFISETLQKFIYWWSE
jgi:hypothetical protein